MAGLISYRVRIFTVPAQARPVLELQKIGRRTWPFRRPVVTSVTLDGLILSRLLFEPFWMIVVGCR